MKTPPKTTKFASRSNQPTMENRREASIVGTTVYISPRSSIMSEVPLMKNVKYLILLPPMSKDVIKEGDLLGHIPNLQYQDYNL